MKTWNDFFEEATITQNYFNKLYNPTGVSSPCSCNIYVHNCAFEQCSSTSSGGAFCSTLSNTKLLIEEATFILCKTSGTNSAAVHFADGTHCIISRICSFECCIANTGSTNGQFGYFSVQKNIENKLVFIDSSIVRSKNAATSSYDAIDLLYGNISLSGINETENKCQRRSGLNCLSFYKSGEITASFSYSTFSNNTSNDDLLLDIETGDRYEVIFCNLIGNKQYTTSFGMIYSSRNLDIKQCCILENNAQCLFYSASKITITNCTFDALYSSTRNHGNVITNSILTNNHGFSLKLKHLSTADCDAIIPQEHGSSRNKKRHSNNRSSGISRLFNFIIHICFLSSN